MLSSSELAAEQQKFARARAELSSLENTLGSDNPEVAILRKKLAAAERAWGERRLPVGTSKRAQRFWARVEQIENGCWLWRGPWDKTRLTPVVSYAGRLLAPRVVAYELQHPHYDPRGDERPHFQQLCGADSSRHEYCLNPDHFITKLVPRGQLRGRPRLIKATPDTTTPTVPAQRFYCDRGHEIPRVGARCPTCARYAETVVGERAQLADKIRGILEKG